MQSVPWLIRPPYKSCWTSRPATSRPCASVRTRHRRVGGTCRCLSYFDTGVTHTLVHSCGMAGGGGGGGGGQHLRGFPRLSEASQPQRGLRQSMPAGGRKLTISQPGSAGTVLRYPQAGAAPRCAALSHVHLECGRRHPQRILVRGVPVVPKVWHGWLVGREGLERRSVQ